MRSAIYILSTGTELSSGRSHDSNAPFLARSLAERGFSIAGFATLPDDANILKRELAHALSRPEVDAVIMTGGLGATDDDFTVAVLAELCEAEIVEEAQAFRRLQLLAHRYPGRFNLEAARRQIRVISTAKVLSNRTGIAPGMLIEYPTPFQSKYIIAMPGVPQEMRAMFEGKLLAHLEELYPQPAKKRIIFYLYGMGELQFQERFFGDRSTNSSTNNSANSSTNSSASSSAGKGASRAALTEGIDIPADFHWGVTAGSGCLRIFMEANSAEILETLQTLAAKEFSDHFLEARAEELLQAYCSRYGIRIATAESCSGGMIAKTLTDRPGSSRYFEGAIVSYSNVLKENLLGVSKDILDNYGAVSSECAIAMAENALQVMQVDFTLSITGIAGPDGGSRAKPVGLVFTAFAGVATPPLVRRWNWPLDRDRIRQYSSHLALFGLYKYIRHHHAS